MKLNFFFFYFFFDPENMKKLGFFRLRKFLNLNVLHKGRLMQDWVFILGFLPRYVVKSNRKWVQLHRS